jgi:hypothetical protein
MKLPNAAQALVAKAKVIDYLLSESHPDGRGKARFFLSHGFETFDWERLAEALLRHAIVHPVSSAVETPFGLRYVVDGALESPDGRLPVVRTVWFVRNGRRTPELVTAYPVGRRSQ